MLTHTKTYRDRKIFKRDKHSLNRARKHLMSINNAPKGKGTKVFFFK